MLNINFNRKPKTVIEFTAAAPSQFVWSPASLETVLFLDEDTNTFKIGLFVDTFNNMRGLRSADDNRVGKHFEASPFHNEVDSDGIPVTRARVIDIETGFGQWADIGYILEHTRANVEIAHESNRLFREREMIERLEAFGEVEAVA